MDARLAEIEANLSRAPDVKELREEGVTDPKQAIENISWQSEVTTSGEQFERWSALLASVVCALVHLPALALESCWPSLLGQIFSFYPTPRVLTTSHWVALGATLVCISLNLGFLGMGAKRRRGLMPLMLAIAGSGLVALNPVYFLLADYQYTYTKSATDGVVVMLTIVGLVILLGASSWNASVDLMLLARLRQPWKRRSSDSASTLGAHIPVESCDLDSHLEGVPMDCDGSLDVEVEGIPLEEINLGDDD